MRFDITYRTTFSYEELVRESQNELRACPASNDTQQLISYRVTSSPAGRVLSFHDYWGTRVDAFGVRHPHLELHVVAEAAVETRQRPLLTAFAAPSALRDPSFVDEHAEFLAPSPHATWSLPIRDAAARTIVLAGDDVVSWVLALHRFVGSKLTYEPGATYVGVEVEQVLAQGSGVCQDYAHLAIALCRSVGVPARYVSGYLFAVSDATGAAPVASDVISVQTHAWFEAAVPGVGWIALDPTNRQAVGERHVKIGHGRDYDDVPPLRGVYAGTASSTVAATVEIRRAGPLSQAASLPANPAGWGSSGGFPREPAAATDPLAQQHQAQQQ